MDALKAALLGALQGLTEFLPISSSGHLVLAQKLLGLSEPELLFDVAVHVGTLAAVLVVFREDLLLMVRGLWQKSEAARQGRRMIWLVVVGSVPTAAIGLLFRHTFESLFSSTLAVGVALLVTGGLLMATRLAPGRGRSWGQVGLGLALAVGLIQGLAITPGISRSGATISLALLLGMERQAAAHYSFLLSIPAIMGALLLQLLKLDPAQAQPLAPIILGAAVAALSGYLALLVLLRVVRGGHLYRFAYYCWPLGLAVLCW